jgi:hypothetical protein
VREVVDQQPLTEVATLERCPRCGAPVLAGHADGLLARVDLIPVDEVGELAARLIGRWTYDVIPRRLARGAVLVFRDLDRLSGARRTPVAIGHRCSPAPGLRRLTEPEPALAYALLGRRAEVRDLVDPPF